MAPLPIIFFASIVELIQASMYGYAEYAESTRRGPLCTRPGVARAGGKRSAAAVRCMPCVACRALHVVRCWWHMPCNTACALVDTAAEWAPMPYEHFFPVFAHADAARLVAAEKTPKYGALVAARARFVIAPQRTTTD